MKITHQKVSTAAANPNTAIIGGPDWNNTHVAALPPTAYAANANVPSTGVDSIEATCGSSSIALTLTAGFIGQPLLVTKVDSGVGNCTLLDSGGALFNGQPSYVLANQYQAVLLVWNGATWRCFGFN